MSIIRFALLGVFLIMVLVPTGPGDNRGNSLDTGAGFCERYPKTCGASVELATAFKLKLAYGVTLARQALLPQGDVSGERRRSERIDSNDRIGEWRPAGRPPRRETYAGQLAQDERSPEWRRD